MDREGDRWVMACFKFVLRQFFRNRAKLFKSGLGITLDGVRPDRQLPVRVDCMTFSHAQELLAHFDSNNQTRFRCCFGGNSKMLCRVP